MSTRIGPIIFALAGLTTLVGCQTTAEPTGSVPDASGAVPASGALIQPLNRAAGADAAANEDFAAAVAALAANPQSGVRQVGGAMPVQAPVQAPTAVTPAAPAPAPGPEATQVAAQPPVASPFVLPSYAPAPMLVPASYPNAVVPSVMAPPPASAPAPAAAMPPQEAAGPEGGEESRRIRRF